MATATPEPAAATAAAPELQSALPSPLDAIPDMRATAKWILAAAAAVGAALLGGAPLTAVGKVHGAGHAFLAFAGLAIGLAGVGWAIWHTADALIPPLTTPLSLDSEPRLADLRRGIARDPGGFFGPFGAARDGAPGGKRTMARLQEELAFHRKVARDAGRKAAADADPSRRRAWEEAAQAARDNLAAAQARQRSLLELAHAWQVRAQLRSARLHSMAGAAVAAAGAVLFLVATG